MNNILLTIFTPAYNRSPLLPRLFVSISSQVGRNTPVEWLVIDDGSSDDTVETLIAFRKKRPDLLRFFRTENGGKHRAINLAAKKAVGDWIMIIDSDDVLRSGAISNILKVIQSENIDNSIGLIRGLKSFPERDDSVARFHIPANPCHHFEWISNQASFDTSEVIRRQVLLNHPFSEYEGERFQAESALWFEIDKFNLTYFVNSPWVACFYQEDGLSAQSRAIRANSPKGAMDVYSKILESKATVFIRLRAAINWWCYYFHSRKRYGVVDANAKQYWRFAFFPFGYCLYLRDRIAGL